MPVFDDLGTLVLQALLQGSPASLIHRMAVGSRNGDAAQRDTGELPLLPCDCRPVDEPNEGGEVVASSALVAAVARAACGPNRSTAIPTCLSVSVMQRPY